MNLFNLCLFPCFRCGEIEPNVENDGKHIQIYPESLDHSLLLPPSVQHIGTVNTALTLLEMALRTVTRQLELSSPLLCPYYENDNDSRFDISQNTSSKQHLLSCLPRSIVNRVQDPIAWCNWTLCGEPIYTFAFPVVTKGMVENKHAHFLGLCCSFKCQQILLKKFPQFPFHAHVPSPHIMEDKIIYPQVP